MPPRFLTSTHDGRTFVISTQEPLFVVAEVLIFAPDEKQKIETAKRNALVDCVYELANGSYLYMWPLKKIETGGSTQQKPADIALVLREMAEWYAKRLSGEPLPA